MSSRDAAELRHLEEGFRRFGEALVELGSAVGQCMGEVRVMLEEDEPEPPDLEGEREAVETRHGRLVELRGELVGLKVRCEMALIGLSGNGEDWALLSERFTPAGRPVWRRWNQIVEAFKVEVTTIWQPLVENLDRAIEILNDEVVSLRTRLLKLEEVSDE